MTGAASIVRQLEARYRAETGHSPLASGASTEALAAATEALGAKLPPDVERLYDAFDGQRFVPGSKPGTSQLTPFVRGLEWLPLNAALSEHEEMMSQEGESDFDADGPVKPVGWHRGWLPHLLIGGASEYLCLDMAPAPGGTVGQIIFVGDLERRVVCPDVATLWSRVAKAWSDGEAVLSDGALHWGRLSELWGR